MSDPSTIPPIRGPRQTRALASAVRQEILDAIEGSGPCTVAQVADQLARPADGLYFHVRALEKAGLLRRVGETGEGRSRAGVFDVPARPVRLDYAGSGRTRTRRLGPVLDCLLRLARRDTARALAAGDAVVDGPARDLWVARVRGRVSKSDLERINALLAECMDIVRDARCDDGGRPIALAFALTPQNSERNNLLNEQKLKSQSRSRA